MKKTNLDKHFKTNPEFEKSGVWYEIAEGIRFLVRPFSVSNTAVKAVLAKYYKPLAKQIELGTVSMEKTRDARIKMFVDACLVDWEGIEIDDTPVEYSEKAATELFTSLPELFETLWTYCQDFKNYRSEDVGNSSAAT